MALLGPALNRVRMPVQQLAGKLSSPHLLELCDSVDKFRFDRIRFPHSPKVDVPSTGMFNVVSTGTSE